MKHAIPRRPANLYALLPKWTSTLEPAGAEDRKSGVRMQHVREARSIYQTVERCKRKQCETQVGRNQAGGPGGKGGRQDERCARASAERALPLRLWSGVVAQQHQTQPKPSRQLTPMKRQKVQYGST
jgi:hypothetical protein